MEERKEDSEIEMIDTSVKRIAIAAGSIAPPLESIYDQAKAEDDFELPNEVVEEMVG